MKRYRYIAGCSVSLADGSFGEIDIPCPRLYASENEALQAEGRNAYRLIHVGGMPGEDGIWERGEKISGGFAVMCDRSTAGRMLYMDHDCYWIAEVNE